MWAAGCRITLSNAPYPSAFIESRNQSWWYFENALSVHTELIYARSDVVAIQALAVMVSNLSLSHNSNHIGSDWISSCRLSSPRALGVRRWNICFCPMRFVLRSPKASISRPKYREISARKKSPFGIRCGGLYTHTTSTWCFDWADQA